MQCPRDANGMQETYGYSTPDWNFPSPTATPTNGSFSQNIFETPKASAYPTHFQDAFTTPQMPNYATPQQTQYPSMTPMQHMAPQQGYTNAQHMQQGGAQHMAHPGSAPLQQGQFMSSPGFATSPSAANTSFGSIQVQTPPPTRGTSARKPQQQPGQQIEFGTPSTIASRRFMTPQQVVPSNGPAPFAQQSPMQFPHMHFSPDINQFVNLGAASAPVMPQSRMLWEQHGSPNQSIPQATLDDPFAPNTNPPNPWSPAPGPQSSHVQQVSFDTPAMDSFPVQALHPRPASAAPVQPATTGVNPSLLYSSPAKPPARSNSRQSKARPSTAQENAGARVAHTQTHARTDTVSSGSTVASRIDQAPQRSNTVGSRSKSAHFSNGAGDSYNRSNSFSQVPRTASPVKRQGRPPLGSISEGKPRQRTSVILTVDENGRARTETRKVEPSPTRSMREKYPALFDSDSSDAESDTSEQTPSKVASFTFDQRDARRAKAARLDPPVENLEGLSIPRSNSSASMRKGVAPSRAAVAAAAQLRRQGSLRKSSSSSSRHNQSRRSSAVIDSAPMDAFKHTNNGAEHLQHHPSFDTASLQPPDHHGQPSSIESMLAAHNRRWSMMSFDQHQQHQQQPMQQMGPMIRCLCGVPSDQGQPLMQCRSCTQWVHAACVGLEGPQQMPGFTCFLCTPPGGQVGALSRG